MTLGGRIPQSLSLPVSYSVSQNGYVMNMRILTFTSLILASTATFAGQRCPANRCPVSVCSTTICEPTGNVAVCGATGESRLSYSSGPTTKLFMGKDGTIREVMTHWEALHRAVEAEQLETDLVAVRSELETATVDLTATKTELAALKEQSASKHLTSDRFPVRELSPGIRHKEYRPTPWRIWNQQTRLCKMA